MGESERKKSAKAFVIIISEHDGSSGSPVGMLASSLCQELNRSHFKAILYCRKVPYTPGGLRMGRLLNYFVLGLGLFPILVLFRLSALIMRRPFIVIPTSNPPLFYLPCSMLSKVLFFRVHIWYQDANLDFIARSLRRRKSKIGGFFANLLDAVDAKILSLATSIVCLDHAMKNSLTRRGVKTSIKVIPPWVTFFNPSVPMKVPDPNHQQTKLIYAGNYGRSHDLRPLVQEFLKLDEEHQKKIRIDFIGMSEDAQRILKDLFTSTKVAMNFFPRLASYKELLGKFADYDFGIVSLSEDYAGISTPSKFYTYVSQGLLVLYIGPRSTLADQNVQEGWGLSLGEFMRYVQNEKILEQPRFKNLKDSRFPDPSISCLNEWIKELQI